MTPVFSFRTPLYFHNLPCPGGVAPGLLGGPSESIFILFFGLTGTKEEDLGAGREEAAPDNENLPTIIFFHVFRGAGSKKRVSTLSAITVLLLFFRRTTHDICL